MGKTYASANRHHLLMRNLWKRVFTFFCVVVMARVENVEIVQIGNTCLKKRLKWSNKLIFLDFSKNGAKNNKYWNSEVIIVELMILTKASFLLFGAAGKAWMPNVFKFIVLLLISLYASMQKTKSWFNFDFRGECYFSTINHANFLKFSSRIKNSIYQLHLLIENRIVEFCFVG